MTGEAHQNENGSSSDIKIRNGSAETLKGPEDDSLSPEEKKLLRTVFISLVLDLLAFTVILPLLPSLLDYYGMKEVKWMFYNKMLYIIIDTNKSDIKMNRRNRERNRQRMRDKRTEPDTSSTQVTSCEIPLEPSLSPSKRVKLTDSSTTAQSPARPQATRTQTYDDSLYQKLKESVHGFRELVGAPDTPRWNSVLFGGLIGSLFSLLQFIASPVIGAASDVYGRKPLLILSMVGVALSYALWAVSHSFGLFVIARIIGGVSKGNISLSTAIVADIIPAKRRGKGMAVIGVAFSIGFVFGPLIGAVFSHWAREQQGQFYVYPALFALALSVADILYVAVVLKETLPEKKRAKTISSNKQNISYLVNPVSLFKFSCVQKLSSVEHREVQNLGAVYFIYLFLYSGLEFTLTFLTHNRLMYDSMQQGKMFFFIGLIMATVQGGYVRRASSGKEKKMAQMGMTLLIPSFITMAFASSVATVYIALVLFSFASATVVPCLTTLVSVYGGEDQKGTIMGVFRSLGALARALGPVVASTVYWSFGAEICYITGGVLLIIPYLLLKRATISKSKQA